MGINAVFLLLSNKNHIAVAGQPRCRSRTTALP